MGAITRNFAKQIGGTKTRFLQKAFVQAPYSAQDSGALYALPASNGGQGVPIYIDGTPSYNSSSFNYDSKNILA